MLTFLIQSSFLDRKHLLTIDSDYISSDDNALQPESPTMFTKALFGSFFYHIWSKWIRYSAHEMSKILAALSLLEPWSISKVKSLPAILKPFYQQEYNCKN